MWKCKNCGTMVENDGHEACWKCSHLRDGSEIIETSKKEEVHKNMMCLRCSSQMDFIGTKKFQEGSSFPILGNLGQFFINTEQFKVYTCPVCGKVEFFMG